MTRKIPGAILHPRPAFLLAGLVAALGVAGSASAKECKDVLGHKAFCGHIINQSGKTMKLTGDTEQSHQQQVTCMLDGHNSSSEACMRDVDTFTFPDTKFRVCLGRPCLPMDISGTTVMEANQPYTIKGEDVICDHPKGHYVRCRIFAKVIETH